MSSSRRNDHPGKITTPKLSTFRKSTPYDRRNNNVGASNSFVASPNTPITTSTPLLGSPSTFFSKVKNMLSPSKLFFGQRQEDNNKNSTDNIIEEQKNQPDHDSISSSNSNIFSFPSPENPYSPKELSVSISSPNERLQDFFKSVGTRPLNEIEIEGVLSLMKQNGITSHGASLSPSSLEKDLASSKTDAGTTPVSTSKIPQINPAKFSTPRRSSPNSSKFSTPKSGYTDQYSPLFTQSKSRKVTPYDSPRIATHYNPIPTPYRPGNRSIYRSGSKSFSRSVSRSPSEVEHSSTVDESLSDNSKPIQDQVAPSKPLSNTASTLLSLLGNDEDEKKKEEKSIPEPKPFINPYASVHKSTPRKPSPSIASSSQSTPSKQAPAVSPVSPAVKELELTKPSNLSPQKPSTSFSSQYKPTKSSSLRESIIASPDTKSPASATNTTKTNTGTPTRLFKFSSPSSTTTDSLTVTPINPIDPPSVFSTIDNTTPQNSVSPSKPLFPNVIRETVKPAAPISTPLKQPNEVNNLNPTPAAPSPSPSSTEVQSYTKYKYLFSFDGSLPQSNNELTQFEEDSVRSVRGKHFKF